MEKEKMTQRQLQKQRTRELIIDAAFSEFANNGFVATRASDVAEAAGLSHGAVFLHFPTMEQLTDAVIERFGERISLRLHELASAGGSLRSVLEAHLQGLTEYEAFYTKLITQRALLPESAKHTFLAIQSSISFHISQAAESEMRGGLIADIPMHLLFNTWAGLVHYYLQNGDLFAPGASALSRCGKELTDFFMRLVAKSHDI